MNKMDYIMNNHNLIDKVLKDEYQLVPIESKINLNSFTMTPAMYNDRYTVMVIATIDFVDLKIKQNYNVELHLIDNRWRLKKWDIIIEETM